MNDDDKKTRLHFNALSHRDAVVDDLAAIDKDIIDRITYILETLYEACDGYMDEWFFYGGYYDHDLRDHNFEAMDKKNDEQIGRIGVRWNKKPESLCLILNDEPWEFGGYLPLRWLFEDCTKEIMQGRKLWLELADKKKRDEQAKNRLGSKQRQAALAKLTEEEKEMLGL